MRCFVNSPRYLTKLATMNSVSTCASDTDGISNLIYQRAYSNYWSRPPSPCGGSALLFLFTTRLFCLSFRRLSLRRPSLRRLSLRIHGQVGSSPLFQSPCRVKMRQFGLLLGDQPSPRAVPYSSISAACTRRICSSCCVSRCRVTAICAITLRSISRCLSVSMRWIKARFAVAASTYPCTVAT